MAVETTTRKTTQTMTALLTEFAFIFRALISTPSDIKCIRTNTAANTNEDMEYVADLPDDPTESDVLKYTVEINDNGIGGTVEVAYVSTGSTITIYRETTDIQSSDYEDYNQFPADTVETDLDKRTMVSQERKEDTGRTLKLPITSTLSNIALPESEPNKIFGWNEAGTGIENKVAVDADIVAEAKAEVAIASSHATTAQEAIYTIETRNSDPADPAVGRFWFREDL